MAAKLRLLSALCALVAAVIVVWQTNPDHRAGRRIRRAAVHVGAPERASPAASSGP